MNISSGGLSFDFTATNDSLKKIVQDSKNEIQGLADASKAGGKVMDAAFKTAFDNLQKNAVKVTDTMSECRQAMKGLEQEITTLRANANAAFEKGDLNASVAIMDTVKAKERELAKRKECVAACYEALDAIEAERQRLNDLKTSTDNQTKAAESLKTQLRRCKEQLAEMEATQGVGVRETAEFKALQEQAGRLADSLADAQAQIKIFSDDNAQLTGLITGIGGVAGAFSAAQGAMSLFGVESDKVQQAMLKVQSLMAITTGLQQVANAVNKDSAFMLTTVRKAKELLAAANYKLATALGVSTAAAKALMATLTVGLSLAITAAIMLFEKFNKKTAEATKANETLKKAFDDYHKTVASKTGDLVGRYEKLRSEYGRLKDAAAKQEWIKQNASEFDNLELSVKNVTDADNVFVKNTKAVVDALQLRAKALALQEMQVKAYQEYYNQIIAADNSVDGGGFYTKYTKPDKNPVSAIMPDEWSKAGLQNGVDYTSKFKGQVTQEWEITQAGVDKINAYRIKEALKTNKTIHDNAAATLKKTTDYAEDELTAINNELQSKGILKNKTTTTDGGKTTTTGNSTTDENKQYAEQLNARKALYQKYLSWATSSDETVRQAAAQEFKPLLESGETYLKYLENQRAEIESKAEKTADDVNKLSVLNNAIAEETKNSVIDQFTKQLNEDLAACQSLGAMLDLIEQRRKDIADDHTEVGDQERTILDDADSDTQEKMKDAVAELLDAVNTVNQQTDALRVKQLTNISLLTTAAAKATDQEQKNRILKAIETYEQLYALGLDNVDDLDRINEDVITRFGTYEQRRLAIVQKYEAEIKAARLAGNEEAAKKLEGERDMEIVKETAAYKQLFDDVAEIGTKTAQNAYNAIKKTLDNLLKQGKITAKQYKEMLSQITDQVKKVTAGKEWSSILGDNTGGGVMDLIFGSGDFETKIENFKNMFKKPAADTATMADASADVSENMGDAAEGAEGAAGGAASAIGTVDTIIKAVYQTLRAVSDTLSTIADYEESIGNGDSADTLRDWSDCINAVNETAMSGWENLKSGNILGAISDTISMPFKLLTTLNKIHDKKYEKSIKKHQQEVTKLEHAYNALEYAVKNALGEEVYTNQTAMINNLKKQQSEVLGMISDEEAKKNSDADKLEDYKEQYAELGREITDIMNDITESITQTTATDLASDLADALVEAFEGGTDAAKAFGEVADDVIKNAVVNALKLQLLEQPLQAAIKQLQKDMGFDEEGNGTFDGLTESEQQRFKDAVAKAGANFQEAMNLYKDLFEDLEDTDPTTLSGALQSASQESIDLLAGQTNAVRQNQVKQLALIQQQLLSLNNIDNNTSVIVTKLNTVINYLAAHQSSDLRSQGITD
jgi:hypothetical protein